MKRGSWQPRLVARGLTRNATIKRTPPAATSSDLIKSGIFSLSADSSADMLKKFKREANGIRAERNVSL